MKKLLEQIKLNYRLKDEEAAFDVVAPSLILNRSPLISFNEYWIKKEVSGKYQNSAHDGKIDAIYFNINHNDEIIEAYFFQNEVTNFAKSKMVSVCNSINLNFIEDNDCSELPDYLDLVPFQKKFRDIKIDYENYTVKYIVSFSRLNSDFRESALEEYKNEVEASCPKIRFNYYGKSYFENQIERIQNIQLNEEFNDVSYNVDTEGFIEVTSDKFKTINAVISDKTILKMISEECKKNYDLSRLFNDNVRGLIELSDINNEILKTIEDEGDSFFAYNNGVTIFCDYVNDANHEQRIKIKNPRILNGQQTIAQMYKQSLLNKQSKVIAKFIMINPDFEVSQAIKIDLMNNLCKTSNRSNQVDMLGLVANDIFFRSLKAKFASQGIEIKIKKGEFLEKISFFNLMKYDFEDLFKIWCSTFFERPDYAKAKGKAIELLYQSLFNDKCEFSNLTKMNNLDNFYYQLKYTLIIHNIKDVIQSNLKISFYENASAFINYIIFKENMNPFDLDFIEIESRIDKCIKRRKASLKNEDKEYDHNTYFKSLKPVRDYLQIFHKKEHSKSIKYLDRIVKV